MSRVAGPVLLLIVVLLGAADRTGTASAAAAATPEQAIDFGWIKVYLDPRGRPLAAWQLEVVVEGGGRIVGIEGGSHPAFAEPPHYDPKAMQNERAILAAFDTDAGPNLPKTRFRVATVMVATRGEVLPECTVKFSTAATVGGGEIAVDIDHEEGR